MNKNKIMMLIYGQSGMGKTTFAVSSTGTILFDFDRGSRRLDPMHTIGKEIVQAPTYKTLLDYLNNSNKMEMYETIVIDSLSRLIESIVDDLKNTHGTRTGGLKIDAWQQVDTIFKSIVKLLIDCEQNVIFVDHEVETQKEAEDGRQLLVKRPSSRAKNVQELLKDLDLVGYMHLYKNQRRVDYNANELYYAKNTAGFNEIIAIPEVVDYNGILADILQRTLEDKKEREAKANNMRERVIELETRVVSLKTLEDYNNMLERAKSEGMTAIECNYLLELMKKYGIARGYKFDREAKQFIQKGGNNE